MAETWVLNATVTLPSSSLSGTFTSNGKSFTGIKSAGSSNKYLSYTLFAGGITRYTKVYQNGRWINDAYRTLVFDTAPTGDMLTWLQANGQKQSEPEPETPTNTCLIDGTIYGIKTGNTLVNGTAQTIYNGRTLVGGTGYDIVLSTSGFTVTITGNGSTQTAWVNINGTIYTSQTTLIVEAGTMIRLLTGGGTKTTRAKTKITIDGVTVAQGTESYAASYSYTPTGDITVTLSIHADIHGNYGTIAVTTS